MATIEKPIAERRFEHLVLDFLAYLEFERGLSRNTLDAYRTDLLQFGRFLEARDVSALEAQPSDIAEFLEALAKGEAAGNGGAACSFGWAAADLRDPGEDRSGWLERQASGRALDAAAEAIGLPDGATLVRAARGRDAAAIDALTPAMQALGTALAGAVALLAPQAIILAGGVAASLDVLKPLILPALRRQLPPHLRAIDIRPGQFGPRAGLVGAAFAGAYGPNWRNGHG